MVHLEKLTNVYSADKRTLQLLQKGFNSLSLDIIMGQMNPLLVAQCISSTPVFHINI
jgi:hypothetical protein